MSVALGKKIFGGLLVVAGINVMARQAYDSALVTGLVMAAIGAAIFAWGFRR
jgi:Ca2+/Na+ antiporter